MLPRLILQHGNDSRFILYEYMSVRAAVPLEREIQASILEYLHVKKIFCWRNNSGVNFLQNGQGKFRAIRIGLPGSSDILGVMPDGRFLAIEVKRPGKKPTPEQEAFLHEIASRGGVAFVACSIDEVIHTMNLA